MRRPHLDIVVEIDKHIPFVAGRGFGHTIQVRGRAAGGPGFGALRPVGDGGFIVTAGVEFFRAVQADLDEIGGYIGQAWPSLGIGADEGYLVVTQ